MTNEHYQRLDGLVESNKELTLKLSLADVEIAHLKIEVKRLEDGQEELVVKLTDSDKEVGRLNMVLNRNYADLTTMRRHDKCGK